MEKRIVESLARINVTGGITFDMLTHKYNEKVKELHKKYDNVHDITVTCSEYEYNVGENYTQELLISFKRNETDEETIRRIELQESFEKHRKEAEKDRLKELVKKYPDLAKELCSAES